MKEIEEPGLLYVAPKRDRVDSRPMKDPRERVRRTTAPTAAQLLTTLDRVDYSEAFVVGTDQHDGRTAEQWARISFESLDAQHRVQFKATWLALGLRVSLKDSPSTVLGWVIRSSTPEHVLLSASSWTGVPAEILFRIHEDEMLFATSVGEANPVVRVMWERVLAPGTGLPREVSCGAPHVIRLRRPAYRRHRARSGRRGLCVRRNWRNRP